MTARNKVAIALGVALVLLAAAQVVLPGLGERRIENRLTEGGGNAEARLSATPAARLLWSDGDSIEITGSGLDLDLTESDPVVFDRLDGFDEVSLELTDFRAGPFDVSGFELRREGSGPYALRSSSTTTAADLVASGADALGVAGGGLLGFLAGRAPGGDEEIPIELEMEMESGDGRIQVVSGGGTVNGYETDALARFITAAIVVRL
ncbi:MAG: hypothetical protein ACXWZM_07900 [Solirubrobacterales bacterium]